MLSTTLQEGLSEYLRRGGYDRHLRQIGRASCRERV